MFTNRLRLQIAAISCLVIGASAASAQIMLDAPLPKSDMVLLMAAAEKLYKPDNVKIGTVETWSGPDTGNSGSVTLTLLHVYKGAPCRRLEHVVKFKGESDPLNYVVDRCKAADGTWKLLF